jgi:hypothetical protein
MTLDPKEAASSLDDIAAIERRTRETLYYGGVADIFFLWGGLTFGGHLLNWFVPSSAVWAWPVIDIAGFIATVAIVMRRFPRMRRRGAGLRWIGSYAAFLVFGAIVVIELWPLTARQQQVFWPTLVMFSYVLAGMWVGRFFLYIGLAATALLLFGYYFTGDWFTLWLAFVFGGGLIAGGLWLRRSAL